MFFQTRDLLGYALKIGHAHHISQTPNGWLEYDKLFRTRTSLGESWALMNPSIWQTTVYKPAKIPRRDYAPVSSSSAYRGSAITDQFCFKYNDGRHCPGRPDCRRRHECRSCGGRHPEHLCSRRNSRELNGTKGSCNFDFISIPLLQAVYDPPVCSSPPLTHFSRQLEAPPAPEAVDISSKFSFNPLSHPSSVCPFNIPLWEEMSSDLVDQSLVKYVCEGLREGFSLKYVPGPLTSASKNNPSAYRHKDVVSDYIKTELERGSIAGPFKNPPFENLHISRFGVIPKSETGKWRMILDLSFPEGKCVNVGIPDEDASVSYEGLDYVIDKIIEAGRGCFLSKFDVEAAYRNVPIHPKDRYLLGMRWEDLYFVDLTLPFGCRSAPSIFTAVADVLTGICSNHLAHSVLSHYLDDFIQIVKADLGHGLALRESNRATDILDALGVPIAPKKTIRVAHVIPHLGVVLDTLRMEARLSQDKLDSLQEEIESWVSRRSGTKRELLSLIGKLMYATQVVHHGRPFLRKLINKANALRSMHFRAHLSKEDREDLIWWKDLLTNWNGVSLFSFRHWEFLPNLFITSDASITKGLGIVYGSHWCSIKWPSAFDGNLNIAVLELIPLVISAHLWGHEWSRRKILFRVDNMAVVNSVNSGLPKDLHLAFLVRLLNKLAVLYNFRYAARHLPGKDNAAADALSRLNVARFKRFMPDADSQATDVPNYLIMSLILGKSKRHCNSLSETLSH